MGLERSDWLSRLVGREIRTARRTLGWTQGEVGRRVSVSQSMICRIEAGWPDANLRLLSIITAALSLELSLRVYPANDVPLRDEKQLRHVQSIVSVAHPGWSPLIEARVSSDPRDLRAVDLLLRSAVELCDIEVERDLRDFQAQLRADLRKRDALAERESRPVRFVLALPDTRRMRTLARDYAPLIHATFPAPSRHIWASIRSGRPIGADGLLWLPPITASPAGAGSAGPRAGSAGSRAEA